MPRTPMAYRVSCVTKLAFPRKATLTQYVGDPTRIRLVLTASRELAAGGRMYEAPIAFL